MEQKRPCETCEVKGYSPDLCKAHYRQLHERGDIPETCPRRFSAKEVGKSVAVGAGVGAATVAIALAAVPAAAIKVICGHVLACKIGASAGGGVTGAGINTYRKTKRQQAEKKGRPKRRLHLPIIF